MKKISQKIIYVVAEIDKNEKNSHDIVCSKSYIINQIMNIVSPLSLLN